MSQLTIYVESSTLSKIRSAAKRSKKSISQWVTNLIKREISSSWPAELRETSGSWNDFPEIEKIRHYSKSDQPRESI